MTADLRPLPRPLGQRGQGRKRGTPQSPETRARISAAQRARASRKKIICATVASGDESAAIEVHASPEQLLWLAVIEQAIHDARWADEFEAGVARRWLLDSREFLVVADYAVEDGAVLRETLRRHLSRLPVRRRATLLTGTGEWLRAA